MRSGMRSGPSECPFVRSRRSHRPLPYTSPIVVPVCRAGGQGRNVATRVHLPNSPRHHAGRALRACGSRTGRYECRHHSRPTVVAGVNIRQGAHWLAAVCRHALLDDVVDLRPSMLPCTSGAAYRPLASWPQTETPARENALITILDRTFSLIRGCGQGQDRTADLPLFSSKDHRSQSSVSIHLAGPGPQAAVGVLPRTNANETRTETEGVTMLPITWASV